VNIACFVTAHGLGHATRACAVMQALHTQVGDLEFEIFTRVPAWVFAHSLQAPFCLHSLITDIGLVQRTPYEEDLPATLTALAKLLPYSHDLVSQTAALVREAKCKLILCDIAPLGILVAEQLGLPSVLIENFRWDWIYAGYQGAFPQIRVYQDYLGEIFTRAAVHIQTEPLCDPVGRASLLTSPISRAARTSPESVRQQIGVPPGQKMILVTSSAALNPAPFAAQETDFPQMFFVFPDDVPDLQRTPNGVRAPRRFYHPDLVNACHAVAGKAGYSTSAEAYHAGALFAYVGRKSFRESAVLGGFIKTEMAGFEIPDEWEVLAWLPELSMRLEKHTQVQRPENGAQQVARYLVSQGLLG
jgi:hypothetical protein